MKVLWIVNTVFPLPASKLNISLTVFGGWLNSLSESLIFNDEIELAIATVYDVNKLFYFDDKKVKYYVLPCKNKNKYDNKLEKNWNIILDKFNPDIIHIHGTEYSHSLPLINVNKNAKIVVSIQGMMSVCALKYLANISNIDIIKNISLRDIVKNDNIFFQQKKFSKSGKNEEKIIINSDYIIGRTTFDYAHVSIITQKEKYRFCNENLRMDFYNYSWNYDNCEKNSIFVSQASYPIKGFHILLQAIRIIKCEIPNIKIYVAGNNIIDTSSFKKRIKLTGYAKYIKSIIKKYDLSNNIIFLGPLKSNEMVAAMLKANVFVQSSAIENSPNSLGEAMLLGMPCIASNVGGTSDMLVDKIEGFLYPYDDVALLSNYILTVFNNKSQSIKLGKNASKHAHITHNVSKNTKNMIKIYKEIMGDKI